MSDGPILHGQQYEPGKGRTYRFVQQSKDYTGTDAARVTGDEGVAGEDINPTDRAAALTRKYDLAAIITMLEAEVLAVPVQLSVRDLPDVLNSVTVTYNKTAGTGASDYPSSQQAFYFNNKGSGTVAPKATAQASAAILPNVSWDITSYKDWVVEGTAYTFNIADLTVTMAQVLTRLTALAAATVLALPKFKKKSHQIKLNGMQISVQSSATSQASLSADSTSNSGSQEWGSSYSKEVGISTRTETIPETIHGLITIASNTDTQDVSVDVIANTPVLTAGAVTVGAITNNPAAVTGTASASVTPTSLAATTPADIPKTGLYLVEIAGQRDDFGVAQFRCVVVDFTQYA